MNVKSMVAVGFLSVMAATAVMSTSDSFAADARRADLINTIRETVSQSDSGKSERQVTRVDVIETIGSGGPAYPYSTSISH